MLVYTATSQSSATCSRALRAIGLRSEVQTSSRLRRVSADNVTCNSYLSSSERRAFGQPKDLPRRAITRCLPSLADPPDGPGPTSGQDSQVDAAPTVTHGRPGSSQINSFVTGVKSQTSAGARSRGAKSFFMRSRASPTCFDLFIA